MEYPYRTFRIEKLGNKEILAALDKRAKDQGRTPLLQLVHELQALSLKE